MEKRILFLSFSLVTSLFSTIAVALPVGSFKAIDAYCTNPAYKFNADEQAYIDSLRGHGSCKDGKLTSPPCFEDYYIFSADKSGFLVNFVQDMPGVGCLTMTPFNMLETVPGRVEMILGQSRSKSHSNDPNVKITCEDPLLANGATSKISYEYKQDGDHLLLSNPSGPECGNFVLKLAPSQNVPK